MYRMLVPLLMLFVTSAAINVLDDLVPVLAVQETGSADRYIVTAGNLDEGALTDAFDGCAVIWVGGGNTFYLLQAVRRSGFDDLITKKIAAGRQLFL